MKEVTPMPKIAFITRRAPHGSASAREALDAVLASSAFCESIALFFIADGVYQLTEHQAPQASLQRNISPTFGMLELYDIEDIYVCQDSLLERGLSAQPLSLEGTALSTSKIAEKLLEFEQVLHF